MEASLRGKVAVVTGASRGIGQAIARRLAAEGALVAAVSRTATEGSGRFSGSLDTTATMIRNAGGTVFSLQADLSDEDELDAVIPRVRDHFGQDPVILVNNAAARRRFELTFPLMERDAFFDSFTVNVWAPWRLSILALEGMRRAGAGWIVNISSRGASPIPGPPYRPHRVGAQSLYGTTKAALDRLTTAGAMELYEHNVAVNTVAPTLPILTENARVEAALDESFPHEPVETVVEAVLAMCSCDAATTTGRVTYSLPLLAELRRPVRTLDGTALVAGWQPEDLTPAHLWPGYLIEPRIRR